MKNFSRYVWIRTGSVKMFGPGRGRYLSRVVSAVVNVLVMSPDEFSAYRAQLNIGDNHDSAQSRRISR